MAERGVTPVIRNPRGNYLAWCEACHDGYQGGKVTAGRWAQKHDATAEHKARFEE